MRSRIGICVEMVENITREILFLEPVFKQMVWGGNKLATKWGYEVPGDNTGECWGVAAHPNGDCTIGEGSFCGKKLGWLWTEHRELFGNVDSGRFPLMVKIIDTRDDLSLQVHPDDEYAKINENGSLGKSECWYILDATDSAELVIGHNAKNNDELCDMIDNGRWNEFIRKVPVKKGDFIQIEPGTVHAIKGGIQILETQQNSDVTYRIYDYDRLDNGKFRELHIKESKDVITVPAKSVDDSIFNISNKNKNQMNELISCEYYKVWKLDVEGIMTFSQEHPFLIMSVIDGEGDIDGKHIKKGSHFILPYAYGVVSLQGNMQLIASTVPKM